MHALAEGAHFATEQSIMSDEGMMKELIEIQNSAHLELFNKGNDN